MSRFKCSEGRQFREQLRNDLEQASLEIQILEPRGTGVLKAARKPADDEIAVLSSGGLVPGAAGVQSKAGDAEHQHTAADDGCPKPATIPVRTRREGRAHTAARYTERRRGFGTSAVGGRLYSAA